MGCVQLQSRLELAMAELSKTRTQLTDIDKVGDRQITGLMGWRR